MNHEELARKIANRRKHVLLVGPPGSGRTLVARTVAHTMVSSRPHLADQSRIYRCAGLASPSQVCAPLRAPHHTCSEAGLFGRRPDERTAVPNFGEVSLAHGGVLYIDEAPEFRRSTLEKLAGVVREKRVVFGTSDGPNVAYPADILLIAAMNPCPCGRGVGGPKPCVCTSETVRAYKSCVEPLRDLCEVIDLREVIS